MLSSFKVARSHMSHRLPSTGAVLAGATGTPVFMSHLCTCAHVCGWVDTPLPCCIAGTLGAPPCGTEPYLTFRSLQALLWHCCMGTLGCRHHRLCYAMSCSLVPWVGACSRSQRKGEPWDTLFPSPSSYYCSQSNRAVVAVWEPRDCLLIPCGPHMSCGLPLGQPYSIISSFTDACYQVHYLELENLKSKTVVLTFGKLFVTVALTWNASSF